MIVVERNFRTKNYSIDMTEVNIDCLEYVFKHLGMDNLVSMAAVNNWLKTGAGQVFALNFAKKTVVLKDISNITDVPLMFQRTKF